VQRLWRWLEEEQAVNKAQGLMTASSQGHATQHAAGADAAAHRTSALIAEERFKYLTAPSRQSSGSSFATPLFDTFADAVTKLRARAKLFDDNRGGLDGLVETLALAHRKSTGWFLHPHRGLLGNLKRRLQPDLGIYYCEEHIICTTHTALLTVGFTQEELQALSSSDMEKVGRFAYEFGVAAGTYFGRLAIYLHERGYNFDLHPSQKRVGMALPITHTDHHGYLAYKHISDHLGLTRPELSTTVMFLVARVNFVERILAYYIAPTSTLLLRSSFMTAYHATRALQEIEGLGGQSALYQLGQLARDVLNGPDTTFLLGARQVRNVLAHYELRNACRFLTESGDPLDDVLIGLCQRGRAEVAEVARRQLSRISEAFTEVLSKTKLKSSRALLGDHT
jgi:hypothetical protein